MTDKFLSARRVLVVEDEILILMMIETMLSDLGCETVTAAATIDQALAVIDEQSFDAALLDMNLNGSSSKPVAEALVARGVPFTYCTGNAVRDLKADRQDQPVLTKPFTIAQLANILRPLLAP